MSILTVELICLFFAAGKAPAWVKEIGNGVGDAIIWQLKGMFQAASVVRWSGYLPDAGCRSNAHDVYFVDLCFGYLCHLAGDPHVAEAADLTRVPNRGSGTADGCRISGLVPCLPGSVPPPVPEWPSPFIKRVRRARRASFSCVSRASGNQFGRVVVQLQDADACVW